MTKQAHNLLEKTNTYIQSYKLIPPDATVIIGLSGGADSMFLLHTLATLQNTYNIKLIAAHLDHEWRSESKDEADFCAAQAQRYGVPFVSEKASHLQVSKTTGGSREEQARQQRRAFFDRVRMQYNADLIALAHHKDDQHETFFIRLLRGAGVTGLSGIKPKSGAYIHPLLALEKTEIVDFLTTHDIPFVTDPTNVSHAYLRNRIRHILMPALAQCDNRYKTSLDRSMYNLQEADDYIQQEVGLHYKQLTTSSGSTIWIDVTKLFNLHVYLQKKIIEHWLIKQDVSFTPSASLFDEIIRFFNNTKSTTHRIHTSWYIEKKQHKAAIKST
jgi:tRNA(Ile)-lysidine synthase